MPTESESVRMDSCWTNNDREAYTHSHTHTRASYLQSLSQFSAPFSRKKNRIDFLRRFSCTQTAVYVFIVVCLFASFFFYISIHEPLKSKAKLKSNQRVRPYTATFFFQRKKLQINAKKLVMKQHQIKWHHKTPKQQVKMQKKNIFVFAIQMRMAKKEVENTHTRAHGTYIGRSTSE